MTFAQLANEIRDMVRAALDDPENADERDELQQICCHFSDQAVVQWWLTCSECGGLIIAWTSAEAFIEVSGGQEQFDALVEVQADFEHNQYPTCCGAWNPPDADDDDGT